VWETSLDALGECMDTLLGSKRGKGKPFVRVIFSTSSSSSSSSSGAGRGKKGLPSEASGGAEKLPEKGTLMPYSRGARWLAGAHTSSALLPASPGDSPRAKVRKKELLEELLGKASVRSERFFFPFGSISVRKLQSRRARTDGLILYLANEELMNCPFRGSTY